MKTEVPDPDVAGFERVLRAFPRATDFMELPAAGEAPAMAVVNLGEAGCWVFDESDDLLPRPISGEELRERGAFRCKPEDFAELLPAKAWPQ